MERKNGENILVNKIFIEDYDTNSFLIKGVDEEIDKNCVNALPRAFTISTLGSHNPYKQGLPSSKFASVPTIFYQILVFFLHFASQHNCNLFFSIFQH